LFFIKHLSHIDYILFEEIQNNYRDNAIKNGLPTEEQKIKFLIKNNLWTEKQELEIENQKSFISSLETTKKKQLLPSAIEQFSEEIKKEKAKLSVLLNERHQLLGLTVEDYAQKLVNDYYIVNNIYQDQNCTKLFFENSEFDDLPEQEVSDIIGIYNNVMDYFSDENIKKLCLQDFFQSYYFLCDDNISEFFGKPICKLTFYQIKIGNFAKYYKSLLENTDLSNVDKSIKYDPEKLENFASSKKESDKVLDGSGSGTSSLVGATKEDLKQLGLDKNVVSFPNKPMNKDELMKFLGGD